MKGLSAPDRGLPSSGKTWNPFGIPFVCSTCATASNGSATIERDFMLYDLTVLSLLPNTLGAVLPLLPATYADFSKTGRVCAKSLSFS